MKQNVNFSQFTSAFHNMDRGNQFSYEGLRALFDWLEQLEQDTGTESELDVIALCCEFTEYENLAELQENYSDIESFDDLENRTTVIYLDDWQDEDSGFIVQDF